MSQVTDTQPEAAALPGPGATPSCWRDFGDAVSRALRARPDTGYLLLPDLLTALLDGATPTPPDWERASGTVPAVDRALILIGESLGELMTWQNQQAGAVIHNIVPTREAELQQVGASSRSELVLHTEDAFHPDRANLVVLACLRNPDRVPTTVASVRHVQLSDEQWRQLSERRVAILPDTSYGDTVPADSGPEAPAVATVWADDGIRCLRFDPAYSRLPADEDFLAAYAALESGLTAARVDVALTPGDVVILDNDAVAHGRAEFSARYDGNDRWLKRVLVRTGHARPGAEREESGHGQSPVITPQTGDTPWTS
jgi:hypothetical protein